MIKISDNCRVRLAPGCSGAWEIQVRDYRRRWVRRLNLIYPSRDEAVRVAREG